MGLFTRDGRGDGRHAIEGREQGGMIAILFAQEGMSLICTLISIGEIFTIRELFTSIKSLHRHRILNLIFKFMKFVSSASRSQIY